MSSPQAGVKLERETSAVTPLTPRGRQTRDRLLAAAREVFEERGFLDTRVEHIAQTAGVAYGSFYRYFESKEDAFRQLTSQLFEDMTDRQRVPLKGETPLDRIRRANRSYYEAYRRNAKLMAIIEQVATFNGEFRELRRQHRSQVTERGARRIRQWQREGVVDAALDVRLAAMALAAMVDHVFYLCLVQGEKADEGDLLGTLDQLCLRALGLDHEDKGRRRGGARTRGASAMKLEEQT